MLFSNTCISHTLSIAEQKCANGAIKGRQFSKSDFKVDLNEEIMLEKICYSVRQHHLLYMQICPLFQQSGWIKTWYHWHSLKMKALDTVVPTPRGGSREEKWIWDDAKTSKMISSSSVSVFCTEEGGEDCGHCLSLPRTHNCGWCSSSKVCTTFKQCINNSFQTKVAKTFVIHNFDS